MRVIPRTERGLSPDAWEAERGVNAARRHLPDVGAFEFQGQTFTDDLTGVGNGL